MAKFFHLAIGYEGKAVNVADIQKVLDTAGWARYAPNCWIVETDEAPTSLVDRIHAVVSNRDTIFVCELKLENNQGYLQKEIWDWINARVLRR